MLDHRPVRNTGHRNLDKVFQTVCQERRDPSQPPVDPRPLIWALDAVDNHNFSEHNVECQVFFLQRLLEHLVLLPQCLVKCEEAGKCDNCGRQYQQLSELHDYWLYLTVTGTEPVDLEEAVLQHQKRAPVSTIRCTMDPEDDRACMGQFVQSRIVLQQGSEVTMIRLERPEERDAVVMEPRDDAEGCWEQKELVCVLTHTGGGSEGEGGHCVPYRKVNGIWWCLDSQTNRIIVRNPFKYQPDVTIELLIFKET